MVVPFVSSKDDDGRVVAAQLSNRFNLPGELIMRLPSTPNSTARDYNSLGFAAQTLPGVSGPSRLAAMGANSSMPGPGGVLPQVVQPSVDWSCLLRVAATCIPQCGTDIGCYVRCAPAAAQCF